MSWNIDKHTTGTCSDQNKGIWRRILAFCLSVLFWLRALYDVTCLRVEVILIMVTSKHDDTHTLNLSTLLQLATLYSYIPLSNFLLLHVSFCTCSSPHPVIICSSSCTFNYCAPHTTTVCCFLTVSTKDGQRSKPRRVDDRYFRVEDARALQGTRQERRLRCQIRGQLPLRQGQVPVEQERAFGQQTVPLHHLPDAAWCVS